MNKTNGFRDQASASTSLNSREHNNYKPRPSSSAFPTFLRWFKKNDRDQQKPRKILNEGILSIDSSQSDSHDTLDPSSSPTLGNLTPSSSCDSVISTSTTGFAFIKPQNYRPYNDAEAPRICIAQSPETESYRRRIKKYNNSETQNSPGICLKEKYFLYDADTLKSTDICEEGVYDNLEFYDRSLPNVKNSTNKEDKNTVTRRRHHRRTVSDSSKDKKSGAYVHVKGKRKAPPPPIYVNGIILKNEDFYERIEIKNNNGYYDTLSPTSTLNRKKRRAPSPPSSPGSPTQNSVLSEGLLDDKEIKAIIAGTTCNNRDSVNLELAAMPSHYSKNSSENLTNSLKRGSLKSNKSCKSRFPQMIINANVDSKLENAEADIKLVPPISPISPRPWYKRPISVNRESVIPFKREVVLKTMEKRKSKQKEKDDHLPEVGYSRSSIFDTANKFGFFMRTKECHNDKLNSKEKRRSGIGIPNISELDREAAEIVNKEHANQRAKIQAEREKFFNPPEHLILQQQMFGFKSNNCDDKRESHETDPVSTKDLISKFEASSNIARITINTTFIGPTDYFFDKKTEETKIENEAVEITENAEKIINENTETETSKSEAIYSDTASDALSKQAARPDDKQKLTGNNESTKKARETAEKKEAGTNLVTKMSWSCPFCTLENPSWRIICEVCEKLKHFDILNKPSVVSTDSDSKVEHKSPKNVEPTFKTSNPSIESINFVGKYVNKNQNKKAEQADEWEKKAEKVLKYFLPRNTTNALSKSSSESTVGKKPPIFRKSPSPSKLPTSSPNISRKTRLHEQQNLTNKTLLSKQDDNLCTADKKKPLLDSSVIVTTVTPVFFATTTVVKKSEQIEDSNVIDLKEVRHARLAKFQPNLLTDAETPPTDAIKPASVTPSQKTSDYGTISPQSAARENLLNHHDTLEREKRRLREKIRAMNAKALAEKYPLPKTLSLDEETKSNESLNNLDGKAQDISKLGAIKKVFAKNRCSEYFGNVIAVKQEDTDATVAPPPRPKKVSTSVQTSGLVKRTVSPDGTQKLKSENDLLGSESDASKGDKKIYANVAKYENLHFHKSEKNSEQYAKFSDSDKVKVHEITAQLQSQQGINNFKATLKNPLRSISKTDTIALSKIMRNLELAIAEGQHELAAGIAMDLAKMKVSLQVTKIKNRPTSCEIQDLSQAIIVDLYVKDEISQKGPIQMTVKPLMTIIDLKQKASNDFDIPIRLQKWLINDEPAAGDDKTLLECGLKDTKSVFHLHLLAPVNKSTTEKQIKDLELTNLQKKNILDKDGNLSYVSSDSYNNLYSKDYLEGATALPVTKAYEKPKIIAVKEKPAITKVNETKLEGKEKREINEVTEKLPGNPWECPLCTLINNYNNLTCLACSKAKPFYDDLKQKIGENLFSDELKNFLGFDKTLERPEADKNDLNKTNPNRKSSEIFNIIETKPVYPKTEPVKVVPSYSSPNITKNKYRGVDNYNPNRKINYENPATKNVSPRKEKGRAPPPPNTSTNHYLELLKLDHSEAVPNTESFECPVCFMKFQSGEGVVLRDCLHVFCKECIINTVQFSEEAEVKCPYMDVDYSCDSVLQDREVKALVSKEIYEKYLAKSVRVAECQIENTFHCKTPNCRGWCIYEDNVNQFKCPVCRITNCLTCRLLESDSEFLESSEEDVNMIFSSDTSTDDFELEFEEHMVVTNFGTVISSFSDEDFKKHFRLNRLTVNWLIGLYQTSDTVQSQQKGGRPCVGAQKEIHIFLWYVGNTNTFREIGNLFGISKSGAWNVIVKVSTWLISIGHQYVKWPSTEEVTSLMNQWEHKNKIPFVIGAIDSSHIRIKAPTENKECYFNRKHYYSVHLQAVVDIKKKFLDIFVGEPGSMHDSRVLRRSKLFWEAHANKNDTFPHNSLILGDSAYPHLEWLVPPFRDNGQLSNEEVQFNVLHSSARISVENAFGMLKLLVNVVSVTNRSCITFNSRVNYANVIYSNKF